MTQPFFVSTMTAAEEAAWMAAMRGGVTCESTVTPPPTRHKQRAMTIRKERVVHPKPPPSDDLCSPHHYILSTPDGPTCEARCKKCGKERQYRNASSDLTFTEQHGWSNRTWRD